MYFTNINDEELNQFHDKVHNNFSMPLVEVLSSSLFKIETIIQNNIYKIYPLFYCDEIASSNPIDQIIEDKCVICTKNTDTRLYFKTTKDYIISSLNCCYTIDEYTCVFGTVYDEKGNVIEGVEVSLEYNYPQQTERHTKKAFTDKDGIFYIGVGQTYKKEILTIKYNDLELEVVNYAS